MTACAGDYLAMRRSLGFKLRGEGQMLAGFARRLDEAGQATVTISAALAWATEPHEAAPAHRRRQSVVRGFARHLATLGPADQVPPAGLLVARSPRPPPYIYSPAELVHAAGTIGAPWPSATRQALISLLAATGLRVGEMLAHDRGDATLDADLLTVTGTNDQIRLVPRHPTTADLLAGYAARRDRLGPPPASLAFFIITTGQRAQQHGVAGDRRPARGPGRRRRATRAAPAPGPPPEAHLRRHYADRLVSGRRRRGGPAADPAGLPRPLLPGGDVVVSAGHARTARAGRRAAAATG